MKNVAENMRTIHPLPKGWRFLTRMDNKMPKRFSFISKNQKRNIKREKGGLAL